MCKVASNIQHSNRIRTTMNQLSSICGIFLILTSFIQFSLAIRAYDCQRIVTTRPYAMQTEDECVGQLNLEGAPEIWNITLVQAPRSTIHKAHYCSYKVIKQQFYCAFSRSPVTLLNHEGDKNVFLKSVPLEECQRWKLNGAITIGSNQYNLMKNIENKFLVSNQVDKDGFCTTWKEKITVEWHIISTGDVSIHMNRNPIGEVVSWSYSSGELFQSYQEKSGMDSAGRQVVLDEKPLGMCTHYSLFKGEASSYMQADKSKVVLIDELKSGVRLVKETTLCNVKLWMTSDPYIYVVRGLNYPALDPSKLSSASITSLIRSISEYSVMRSIISLKDSQATNAINFCRLESSIRREVVFSSHSTPEMLAFRFLGVTGWTMHKSGNLVKIGECTQMNVKINPKPTCYDLIPIVVEDSGKEAFVHPVTWTIHHSALEISCSDPSLPGFTIGGQWYELSPTVRSLGHINSIPSNLTAYKKELISKPGLLYSDDLIEQLENKTWISESKKMAFDSMVNSYGSFTLSSTTPDSSAVNIGYIFGSVLGLKFINILLLFWCCWLTWKVLRNQKVNNQIAVINQQSELESPREQLYKFRTDSPN